MPSPTRQEIIDANNALAALVCVALSNTADPDEKDWIKTEGRAIAAVLPPKPRPTMAEVEWDDDKHFLAEAEHPEYGKVIMLVKDFLNRNIGFLFEDENKDNDFLYAHPRNLTPTGKRYTLTEIEND